MMKLSGAPQIKSPMGKNSLTLLKEVTPELIKISPLSIVNKDANIVELPKQ